MELFLVSWKILVHGRVLRLGRVWRKLGRGISRGGLEVVERTLLSKLWEVACSSNKYAFDDGGIIQVKKQGLFTRIRNFLVLAG
jgi:hypothetical protein